MLAYTRGVHHVGLTVSDCRASARSFVETLGFEGVGGKPDYFAIFFSDASVMLTLRQAQDPTTAQPFDRRNGIGLHHLALNVADAAALDQVHARLPYHPDVAVEFAPEATGGAPLRHRMRTVPGGVRVEFVTAVR